MTLISNSTFLPVYVAFLLLGSIERIISTFVKKDGGPSLRIYHRWSFFIAFFTYLIIVFFSIIEHLFFVRIVNLIISMFGFIIFFSGVLLRRKAIADLGKNWSIYIEIKKGHELITGGAYNFLRHPYYMAVLLELTGICLIGNSFYSLISVIIIQAPLLVIRAILEEEVLLSHFGNVYREYRKTKVL